MAAALAEAPGVKPVLWTEWFNVGDITFMAIEAVARRVACAVFLATPEDESEIDLLVRPAEEASELEVTFASRVRGSVYSRGTGRWPLAS